MTRQRLTWILTATLGLSVVIGAAAPYSARAQTRRTTRRSTGPNLPHEIPKPEPLVTLKGQKLTMSRALRAAFQNTPYKYRLSARVPLTFVKIDVKRRPLSEVLNTILSADKNTRNPLVWRRERDTITIVRESITMGVNDEAEKVITLSEARIGPVLARLFKLMKTPYRIQPNVPPILITLTMRPRKWENALPDLMDRAYQQDRRITFSIVKGTYIVHIHQTPIGLSSAGQATRNAGRLVTLASPDTPLREALAKVFEGSKWKIEVAEEVKDTTVNISANKRPELAVLRDVLRQVSAISSPITYREGRGTLYVEPGPLPGQAKLYARALDSGELRRTSLNLTQQKLSDAIKLLAQSTGAKVTIAKNVPDIRISFTVNNVTIEEALRAVVASGRVEVPNLTFRKVDERTFQIRLGSTN